MWQFGFSELFDFGWSNLLNSWILKWFFLDSFDKLERSFDFFGWQEKFEQGVWEKWKIFIVYHSIKNVISFSRTIVARVSVCGKIEIILPCVGYGLYAISYPVQRTVWWDVCAYEMWVWSVGCLVRFYHMLMLECIFNKNHSYIRIALNMPNECVRVCYCVEEIERHLDPNSASALMHTYKQHLLYHIRNFGKLFYQNVWHVLCWCAYFNWRTLPA